MGRVEYLFSGKSDVAVVSPNCPHSNVSSDDCGRFFCAAIAALTLRVLDPYGHGRLVLLEVNYSKDHHSNFIYLIAVFLGIVGVSRQG